jgi:hypothetical protein
MYQGAQVLEPVLSPIQQFNQMMEEFNSEEDPAKKKEILKQNIHKFYPSIIISQHIEK